MKQYVETKEGSFQFEGMSIPNAVGNRHYQAMVSEVNTGKATIKYFDKAADLVLVNIASERSWREEELARADIELNKVQDGIGVGLVGDWRAYRNLLRTWPEDANFPEAFHRPKFTNSEG